MRLIGFVYGHENQIINLYLYSSIIEREVDNNLYTLTRNVTAARWTFVINKDGRVVYKSSQVNAAEDGKNVVEVLKKLE